jgi:hypothetical protein
MLAHPGSVPLLATPGPPPCFRRLPGLEASRLDRVRIDVAGDIVEITWDERDVLLQELAAAPGTKVIRVKFEAVGASRPVELDEGDRSQLRRALDDWGSDRLQPDGIARLHAALARADPSD